MLCKHIIFSSGVWAMLNGFETVWVNAGLLLAFNVFILLFWLFCEIPWVPLTMCSVKNTSNKLISIHYLRACITSSCHFHVCRACWENFQHIPHLLKGAMWGRSKEGGEMGMRELNPCLACCSQSLLSACSISNKGKTIPVAPAVWMLVWDNTEQGTGRGLLSITPLKNFTKMILLDL